MTLLILGLILWTGAHFFRRILPRQRARMGDTGKGLVSLLVVASIVAMIYGYRWADFIPVWQPPAFMTHINNALMLLALWSFGSSAAKGGKVWPASQFRHPQLIGFSLWAIAHLLVNGDLASILLFGGLLVWALASIVTINRAEPHWVQPGPADTRTKVRLLVITLVLFALVTALHYWLGVSPFPT